jgi:hypothetical protein
MYPPSGMYPVYPPAPRKRRVWPWFAAAGAALFIAGAFFFAFWVTDGHGSPGSPTGTDAAADPVMGSTQLRLAYNACGAGDLADNDHTMIIDSQGEDYDSGDASFDDLTCVLRELDVPASVIAQMEQTRALDGMQSADWNGFTASWTYHPDNGLDLIITEP